MSFASSVNKFHRFVLVVIDCFSKFVYLESFRRKEAINVANALQAIFFRDGPPLILQSDNGSEFIDKKVREVCLKFKVEQRHGRAYKPTSQGQVERTNRTLKNAIYADFLQYNSREWVDWLANYAFAYNTTKHSSIGFSPMEVHRGRLVTFMTDTDGKSEDFNRDDSAETTEQSVIARHVEDLLKREFQGEEAELEAQRRRISTSVDSLMELVDVGEDEVARGSESDKPPRSADPKNGEELTARINKSNLSSYAANYTFTEPPEVYVAYMAAMYRAKARYTKGVAKRIGVRADRMIDDLLLKSSNDMRLGDTVRINMNVVPSKDCKRPPADAPKTPRWSEKIYIISAMEPAEGRQVCRLTDKYSLEELPCYYEKWMLYRAPYLEPGDKVRINLASNASFRRMFGCIIKNRNAKWSRSIYEVVERVLQTDMPGRAKHEPEDLYLQRVAAWEAERNLVEAGGADKAPREILSRYRIVLHTKSDQPDADVEDEADADLAQLDERDDSMQKETTLYAVQDLLKVNLGKMAACDGFMKPKSRPKLDFGKWYPPLTAEEQAEADSRLQKREVRAMAPASDGSTAFTANPDLPASRPHKPPSFFRF